MYDGDETVRIGRARLSAVRGNTGKPSAPCPDEPVVPAQSLLQMASVMSEGASRMHAQLSHLQAAEREAILDLVSEQLTQIVGLWADLVRGTLNASGERFSFDRRRERLSAIGAEAEDRRLSWAERSTDMTCDDVAEMRSDQGSPSAETAMTRDELTGVLNRRAGLTALQREMERCLSSSTPLVLGYLNVNGLRLLNENRGPRAGDELLRRVSAALRATLRSYDVILRLGGDKFLFSLRGIDLDTAEHRMKEFGVILSEEAPGTTTTVGFADLRPGDNLQDLIDRAEQALHQTQGPHRQAQ